MDARSADAAPAGDGSRSRNVTQDDKAGAGLGRTGVREVGLVLGYMVQE